MDRRLVVVLFLFVPVLSCSTTSGPGGKAAGVAGDLILPASQEEQLGERFSQQIEQELELHQDPKVQAYLQALGESAVRAAGDDVSDPIEFEFHVIDKPDTMNAFAGPGGQIYFFSGLLREADNAAEVMGVMVHEVAHVSKRHVAERMATQFGIQTVAAAALGEDPGLLPKLATSVATQGFMLKYSRDMERQADDVGFNYMTETSYDPVGMVSFFEKLGAAGGPSPPTFLSSHPNPEQRVAYLTDALQAYGDPPDDFLGEEAHREIVQLLGGEPDEQEGESEDRVSVHP